MTKPESLIRQINSLNNGRCEPTNARNPSPSLAKRTENLNLVYSIHRLHPQITPLAKFQHFIF